MRCGTLVQQCNSAAPSAYTAAAPTLAPRWSGVCDALQVQRCIVFCVLDGSGVILVSSRKGPAVAPGAAQQSALAAQAGARSPRQAPSISCQGKQPSE
jgi:hypothetical protein